MVRFVYVLRQLFKLTIGSGGGSLIPGLRVPLRVGHALNITYAALVMLHFYACLWWALSGWPALHLVLLFWGNARNCDFRGPWLLVSVLPDTRPADRAVRDRCTPKIPYTLRPSMQAGRPPPLCPCPAWTPTGQRGKDLRPPLHPPQNTQPHTPHTHTSPHTLYPSLASGRNFIAIKEGLEGTWLNPIAALVRRYSADGASPLTAEELAGVPAGERYVLGLYFSAVTIATLGYGE